MFTLSNLLSFVRFPLAFVFLQKNVPIRVVAIVLAMITDSIDGYFARKYKSASKFGAVLDPAMDKFFVYFALTILFIENKIELWQAMTFLSRDFALCLYGLYIVIFKRLNDFEIKAIRWGKITTATQFIIIIGVTIGLSFSWYIYSLFIVFGLLALYELVQRTPKKT